LANSLVQDLDPLLEGVPGLGQRLPGGWGVVEPVAVRSRPPFPEDVGLVVFFACFLLPLRISISEWHPKQIPSSIFSAGAALGFGGGAFSFWGWAGEKVRPRAVSPQKKTGQDFLIILASSCSNKQFAACGA